MTPEECGVLHDWLLENPTKWRFLSNHFVPLPPGNYIGLGGDFEWLLGKICEAERTVFPNILSVGNYYLTPYVQFDEGAPI